MQTLSIMHIALGGCVRGEPRYGLTEDTGGHITYILGEARALARRADVAQCEIVTRLFDAPELGAIHAREREIVGPGLVITRIDSGDRRYLSKEALHADRRAFTEALARVLRGRATLPDAIHAHFADAAEVAKAIRDEFGIPFVYTPHSLGHDKAQCCGVQAEELRFRLEEEARAIGAADAVVASSRDECERQLMAYPTARQERIWRIRPGIDQRRASEAEIAAARLLVEPFLRDPTRPIVLAIARPVRKKNLVALVRAFGESPALRDAANLVILPGLRHSIEAGESEQVAVMRELVDAIDRYDLHGTVAYPRSHDQASVRGLYALAARSGGVFANPAAFEPFGLTILEAAVHRCPVVATGRGGPADIVAEIGHGDLVEPEDISAIATALTGLIADRDRREHCIANARARIGAVSWDDYAAQFVGVVRRIRARTDVAKRARPACLLVCDIDNTLTGCRRSAARLTRFLAKRAEIGFAVATGRSLIEARRLVNGWGLPEPSVWITSVGSEIHWDEDGELVEDADFIRRLTTGWRSEAVERVMAPVSGAELQPAIDQRRFKRSWFYRRPDRIEGLRADFARAGIEARVIFSHDRLLDVLPLRAGKGAAVHHVARRLGLALDRVIVAGDSGNDADMIEACPRAVVVANCEEELRMLGLKSGAFMATRPHAAGVLEGLIAHTRNGAKETAA